MTLVKIGDSWINPARIEKIIALDSKTVICMSEHSLRCDFTVDEVAKFIMKSMNSQIDDGSEL